MSKIFFYTSFYLYKITVTSSRINVFLFSFSKRLKILYYDNTNNITFFQRNKSIRLIPSKRQNLVQRHSEGNKVKTETDFTRSGTNCKTKQATAKDIHKTNV